MRTEHTIGVIIIILLAIDVYFAYQNYLLNQEKNR